MFPKPHRLSKSKDIQRTFTRGRSFFYPLFGVKFVSKPSGPSRFTVVVSTKISKKAVRRNRIKRVIRETFRTHQSSLKTGDYMILARPAAEKAENKVIRDRVIEGLKSAKLLI